MNEFGFKRKVKVSKMVLLTFTKKSITTNGLKPLLK